ncbi:MAG: prepilin-type N-terminal cleavage/methylation domain-containing protein [Planctomycetota bacterium]
MMQKKAFTLVELLVVCAVITVLLAVLVPVLGKSRQIGQRLVCMSNLRQMVVAAQTYALSSNDYFPLVQDVTVYTYASAKNDCLLMVQNDPPVIREQIKYERVWDFVTVTNLADGTRTFKPGILWQGDSSLEIQQCPGYKGADNWGGQPFTGYNYNASYIGGHCWENPWTKDRFAVQSARATQVKRPCECAVFGDGQYISGANKFMRSPFPGNLDKDFGASNRWAGTQGYRHLGATNVGWADGSSKTIRACYTDTARAERSYIAKGTGFLSMDNSAYDLE